MKFWLHIHNCEIEQMIDLAKLAEDVGFHGVVDGDHWATPVKVQSPYPYTADGKVPQGTEWSFPDNFVSAAAVAMVTKKLKFGTSVFILGNRNNPVQVAKAAGTAAILGGHRLVLGIGGGWLKEEFDMAGIDWSTRIGRMEEMVEVMRKCWGAGPIEHHGKFFDYPEMYVEPSPLRPVPVYIGGHAPAALRRAGRLGDGLMGAVATVEEVPALLATVEEGRKEASDERRKNSFETILGLTTGEKGPDSYAAAYTLENFKRVHDMGLTSTHIGPLPYIIGKGNSTLDEKRRFLESFAERVLIKFS